MITLGGNLLNAMLGNLHDREGASLESCLLAADLPNVHPQVSADASVMTRAIFAISVLCVIEKRLSRNRVAKRKRGCGRVMWTIRFLNKLWRQDSL